ncbi:hypothetical protein GJV44_00419 [Candidatus Vallotia cooleyia]|nr:hypothetical protein GJV44_00419 [Candidatus Vallotia cooleyia]
MNIYSSAVRDHDRYQKALAVVPTDTRGPSGNIAQFEPHAGCTDHLSALCNTASLV